MQRLRGDVGDFGMCRSCRLHRQERDKWDGEGQQAQRPRRSTRKHCGQLTYETPRLSLIEVKRCEPEPQVIA